MERDFLVVRAHAAATIALLDTLLYYILLAVLIEEDLIYTGMCLASSPGSRN